MRRWTANQHTASVRQSQPAVFPVGVLRHEPTCRPVTLLESIVGGDLGRQAVCTWRRGGGTGLLRRSGRARMRAVAARRGQQLLHLQGRLIILSCKLHLCLCQLLQLRIASGLPGRLRRSALLLPPLQRLARQWPPRRQQRACCAQVPGQLRANVLHRCAVSLGAQAGVRVGCAGAGALSGGPQLILLPRQLVPVLGPLLPVHSACGEPLGSATSCGQPGPAQSGCLDWVMSLALSLVN